MAKGTVRVCVCVCVQNCSREEVAFKVDSGEWGITGNVCVWWGLGRESSREQNARTSDAGTRRGRMGLGTFLFSAYYLLLPGTYVDYLF